MVPTKTLRPPPPLSLFYILNVQSLKAQVEAIKPGARQKIYELKEKIPSSKYLILRSTKSLIFIA